jgi:hypothetical protein
MGHIALTRAAAAALFTVLSEHRDVRQDIPERAANSNGMF